jgi:hypothetical protein
MERSVRYSPTDYETVFLINFGFHEIQIIRKEIVSSRKVVSADILNITFTRYQVSGNKTGGTK